MSDAPSTSSAPAPSSAANPPDKGSGKDEGRAPLSLVHRSAEGKARANARMRAKAAKAEASKPEADDGSLAVKPTRNKPEPKPEPFIAEKAEPKTEAKPEADDEKEPEAERAPSWAKKLRGELDEGKKKIADYEAKTKEWSKAYETAKNEIDDVRLEASHYKGLFERLTKGLEAAGFEVDPLEMQIAERDLELSRFRRGKEQGEKQTRTAEVAKMAGDIKGRVEGMIAKYPHDLNPKTNRAAAEYLRWRLEADPKAYPLDTLERDLEAFARHQRASRAPAPTPAATTHHVQPDRKPEASTLAGQSGGAVVKRPNNGPRSDKQIKEDFRRRRIARQGA